MDISMVKLNMFGQKAMTKKEIAKIPAIGVQDGLGDKAIAYVHYFVGGYDFYVTELNPEEGLLFGLGHLHEAELGYQTIEELASIGRVERDLYWTPKTLGEVRKDLKARYGN